MRATTKTLTPEKSVLTYAYWRAANYLSVAQIYLLDIAIKQIRRIQHEARVDRHTTRPRWPMIVLKSPMGWTGPEVVDGVPNESTFHAHQVPLSVDADHLKHLETWLRIYRPEELFDEQGRLQPEMSPTGDRHMGASPQANGGMRLAVFVSRSS